MADGVEVGGARVVRGDDAGNDIGGVEAIFEGDGIGGGWDELDGFDMEESGRNKVVVLTAANEKKAAEETGYEDSFHVTLIIMFIYKNEPVDILLFANENKCVFLQRDFNRQDVGGLKF